MWEPLVGPAPQGSHQTLEASLAFLDKEDPIDPKPLRVVGAGAAGIEVVLALRRRWPQRALQLKQRKGQLDPAIQTVLRNARITLIEDNTDYDGPSLLCTGSQGLRLAGDDWSCPGSRWPDPHRSPPKGRGSSMPIRQRRLCSNQRITPPGVRGWADVPDALGHQSGSGMPGATPRPWHPQREALQLIGSHQDAAWGRWGRWRGGLLRCSGT